MNRVKRILQWSHITLMVLLFELFLAVAAQSQELETLTLTAKGHGAITSAVEEQKIAAALVVLRRNGTMLVTVCADIQLQAEGTWSTSDTSPEEVLLKITRGAVTGDLIGSGRLLLSKDRKSFEQFTIDAKTPDGREIKVTFTADAVDESSKNRSSP
jgi:hypothetical protein